MQILPVKGISFDCEFRQAQAKNNANKKDKSRDGFTSGLHHEHKLILPDNANNWQLPQHKEPILHLIVFCKDILVIQSNSSCDKIMWGKYFVTDVTALKWKRNKYTFLVTLFVGGLS